MVGLIVIQELLIMRRLNILAIIRIMIVILLLIMAAMPYVLMTYTVLVQRYVQVLAVVWMALIR